jgi:hypothetical protein
MAVRRSNSRSDGTTLEMQRGATHNVLGGVAASREQRDVAGRHYLTTAEITALYFATHKMGRPPGWEAPHSIGRYGRVALPHSADLPSDHCAAAADRSLGDSARWGPRVPMLPGTVSRRWLTGVDQTWAHRTDHSRMPARASFRWWRQELARRDRQATTDGVVPGAGRLYRPGLSIRLATGLRRRGPRAACGSSPSSYRGAVLFASRGGGAFDSLRRPCRA